MSVEFNELEGATKVKFIQERLETRLETSRGRSAHARGWRQRLERLREVVENG